MSRPWVALIGGAAALAASGGPATAQSERLEIWDLSLGMKAAEIPDRFVEYACGTNGGPPSRPLAHFADFAMCRPDARGLYEVYFRYDDEQEYLARALEQVALIEATAGTRVYGFPAIVTVLFDAEGLLRGMRIVTDPRGVRPEIRDDFWALGTVLRHHFGDAGWSCAALPLAEGERPVSTFIVKDRCTKSIEGAELAVERRYLQRRGQEFIDERTEAVVPEAFESLASFELIASGLPPAGPAAPAAGGPPAP
jgi:hypothetical protein